MALKSGDGKMALRLRKAFEASSQEKKTAMLRSWCLDGGKCSKHYRRQIHSMRLRKVE